MKIISHFIPQERYEKRLGSIERFKDKPITIFNDRPGTPEELAINPINILLINEPNEFFGFHTYAQQYGHLYSAILSWNSDINLPNSIIFPHGERNIDLEPNYKEAKQIPPRCARCSRDREGTPHRPRDSVSAGSRARGALLVSTERGAPWRSARRPPPGCRRCSRP